MRGERFSGGGARPAPSPARGGLGWGGVAAGRSTFGRKGGGAFRVWGMESGPGSIGGFAAFGRDDSLRSIPPLKEGFLCGSVHVFEDIAEGRVEVARVAGDAREG